MACETKHELVSPGHNYFDLNGDNDLQHARSSEETNAPLTWRGDPNETCSDWTLVVVTNELETASYHVHKSVVCFGSRQAKYFARIMLNQSVDKRKRRDRKGYSAPVPTTKIELDQRDAENFPILLDYIYSPSIYLSSNGTMVTAASTITSQSLTSVPTEEDCNLYGGVEDITTKNAVSLRYLAKRFEVEPMVLAVNRFIQKDLNFQTGPYYLSTAAEYKDVRLMDSAQRLCAENIEQISSNALLQLPTHLFRVVIKSLESFEDDNRELSLFLSEIVCRYLERHPQALNAGILLELTDPLLMPYIASEAAIGITALIKELNAEDSRKHWIRLMSLSRRCAKTVVQEYGWNDFSVDAAVDEYLENIRPGANDFTETDSLLFATSFAAALDQAQEDYEEILLEQQRLESLVRTLIESVTNLERHNDEKNKLLQRQQNAIEAAKKHILDLKQEIAESRRWKEDRATPHDQSRAAQGGHLAVSPLRELVSPSQIGVGVQTIKSKTIKELRTKNEMRSKSIMR